MSGVEFFFFSYSPMTIIDSYIDYLKEATGTTIILQNILHKEINIQLHHLSTFKCDAQNQFLAESYQSFYIFFDISFDNFVILPATLIV